MLLLTLLACQQTSPEDTSGSTSTTDTTTTVEGGIPDEILEMDPDELPQASSPCREPEIVEVTMVSDGDTLKVVGKWGGETVRLIGVNTPEVDHGSGGGECFGDEAWSYATEALENSWVWLSFDVECEDQYDRTLAYVTTGSDKIEGFFQRTLLRGGFAEAFPWDPNTKYESVFAADEAYASGRDLGMWGSCN